MKRLVSTVIVLMTLVMLVLAHSTTVTANPTKKKATKKVTGPPSKVVICHFGKDLTVPTTAVAAHLKHGDSKFPCEIEEAD